MLNTLVYMSLLDLRERHHLLMTHERNTTLGNSPVDKFENYFPGYSALVTESDKKLVPFDSEM